MIFHETVCSLSILDRQGFFFHQLCVHVGVHGLADSIQLEMCGQNHGYNRPDESGKKCAQGCCVDGEWLICYPWKLSMNHCSGLRV